jgi:hypothetical protein
MDLILKNPYRVVGLLVGSTAREQERQIKRLRKFTAADQEPQDDFSFPVLGGIQRSDSAIDMAVSKLNLDIDKVNAGLFWFFDGNTITDEPAFNEIRQGNLKEAVSIWGKLVSGKKISSKNASAFFNWGTLFLNSAFNNPSLVEKHLEKGLQLKLSFLESNYGNIFLKKASDETFLISKKDLQLSFLNLLQPFLEKSSAITVNNFLDILLKIEFSARGVFLKNFSQKPIEQIEKQIEETRKKQKTNPGKAGEYGNELYENTKLPLTTVISILGNSDIKIISICDKLANEILQCSITLFNHFHETNTEVGEIALGLNMKAKAIVLGSVVKERINESNPIVERYVSGRSEREKIKSIKPELEFITSRLGSFEILPDTVTNARDLIDKCKPRILKIKQVLGSRDEFYLNVSSSIVQNAQNMLVQVVNKVLDTPNFGSYDSTIKSTLKTALDATFMLGTFDMNTALKSHYNKNLEGIKSLAKQLNISTLTPKEELQNELRLAEIKLSGIQNTTFFKSDVSKAHDEMKNIKEWQFLRSDSDRMKQINKKQQQINTIIKNADAEKLAQTNRQQVSISDIRSKIQKAEY